MEKVRKPVFFLEYEQKDITRYITPYALSVTYTDYEHGKSDEIDIRLEDREHLWKSSWYPKKGDVLSLKIGYEQEGLLPCGRFEIDEVELAGPPDIISMKGLSANIRKALRQNNTTAYENKSLRQIAGEIAEKHGFELIGEIEEVRVKRITQNQERDLAFLKRIAEEYGYVFKIADNKLVFYELLKLQTAKAVMVIDRKGMSSFSFRDKTSEVYKAATVSYHDPKTKKLTTHTVKAHNYVNGATLKITRRCESRAHAIAKANAALARKNGLQTVGEIVVEGSPKLVAGSNISVTGLYNLNGTYHVITSKHTIDRRAGYGTNLEVARV